MDCCISTANLRRRAENWRVYMADAAYVLMKVATDGKIEVKTYGEITHPRPEDKRTGTEIATDIIKRHGLKVVKL